MKIVAPTNCPSCSSELVMNNFILYCRNNSCSAKVEKRIEHFCKTMKIKGMGPATISKLNLSSIADIYELHEASLEELLDSDKLGKKLYQEILKSMEVPLNTLLPAFGIPLIGKSAADKLSKVCKRLSDVNSISCDLAGIGPKATANLLTWIELELPELGYIPFNYEFEDLSSEPSKSAPVVCITGKLKSFKSKSDAEQKLKEHGYIVKGTITKDVTILVNESGIESAKTQTAREAGIKIVNNIYELFGE